MRSCPSKTLRALFHGTAFAGPLAFLALPKCPFCLLPLMAAAGLAVSPGWARDLLVVLFAGLWGGAVWAVLRSPAALPVVVAVGGVAVAGRWLGLPALAGSGLVAMLLVALALLLVPRTRQARCRRVTGRSSGTGYSTPTE